MRSHKLRRPHVFKHFECPRRQPVVRPTPRTTRREQADIAKARQRLCRVGRMLTGELTELCVVYGPMLFSMNDAL